ncbi:hypothetical protein MAM1_0327d09721 [Mucor ambiguus]|uniref:Uncharacterized protein n=1 Tax=Mucor ambiguus TaxID=91626 RepID=A0A0C9MRV8_9FUNG|nr:hypothetical protein MAM1_0327d09721 [Mucor ambiguus]
MRHIVYLIEIEKLTDNVECYKPVVSKVPARSYTEGQGAILKSIGLARQCDVHRIIQSFLLEKRNEKEHIINGIHCSENPYRATSDLPDDYWMCVLQYHHFVNLVFETETPDMTPIPNIRIVRLTRHLHMLNPAHYSIYRLWNCVINIPRNEAKPKQLAEITNCEWKLYLAKREQNAAVASLNGHKRFAHFNQLISYMTESRSIKHITDDANHSRVYQPANAKDSERVNITKSPDFDWLVPNT